MPRRLTQEEFENKFYGLYSKDEYQILSEYKNAKTKIRIKHVLCGSEFERTPDCLSRNCNCPKCVDAYPRVVPYVNDLWITNPEIAKLLADPEDGHKIKKGSVKEVLFKCPNCEGVFSRSIYHATSRDGLRCPLCSDGTSYSERFFASILNQLKIEYKREYSPKWARPYFYDFYFKLDKKYIVEMDGGWHFCDNELSGLSKEDVNSIDQIKNDRALSNGYIIIRIDANYRNKNRFLYLKESILNSPLRDILDLNLVDFNKCHFDSTQKSLINEAIQMWLDGTKSFIQIAKKLGIHQGSVQSYIKEAANSGRIPYTYEQVKSMNKDYHRKYTSKQPNKCKIDVINDWQEGLHHCPSLAKKYNIDYHTVGKYLKDACEKGILPYTYEQVVEINKSELHKYSSPHYGQKILCNETGEIFNNYTEADKKYHAKVSVYFSCGRAYTGTLPDGTKLTWQKIYDD